jgi:Flp pilus assembly protein TadB
VTEPIIAGIATSAAALSLLLYHWQKEFVISRYMVKVRRKQVFVGIIAVGLSSLFLFVFKNPVASVLSVILLGLYLRKKRELARQARNLVIENQAEVALQLIASFYENTGDIMTAFKEAADCIQSPLADELRLTVTQYNVNKAPLAALQDLAERIDDRNMTIFVNAVILSELYGTNTTQVINNVASKISHRISLRDELENEVRGQSLTIKIFFLVLPAITAVLMLIPDVRQVLTTSPIGLLLINGLLLIEYFAWYFSTDEEVVNQL